MGVNTEFFTGPTYILEAGGDVSGEMIIISTMMILLALFLLVIVKFLMTRLKIPVTKVFPQLGRKLSNGVIPKVKDIFTLLFMFMFVLIPSFYIFMYVTQPMNSVDVGALMSAIGISLAIAGVAVLFDIVFGMPIAIYAARNRYTMAGRILDNLINIPLIIPTTALGFSLALFWGGANTGNMVMSVILVILGHISFTYPLVVRNIAGAIEEVDPSYEETAMTLGAKPFQSFRKVLLPIIKSSVLAGGVLAFTRSLGETGATAAISRNVNTVPIYIMELVNMHNYSAAAACSIVLIVICFVLIIAVRKITHGGPVDA